MITIFQSISQYFTGYKGRGLANIAPGDFNDRFGNVLVVVKELA